MEASIPISRRGSLLEAGDLHEVADAGQRHFVLVGKRRRTARVGVRAKVTS